jgi:hypothetical protein
MMGEMEKNAQIGELVKQRQSQRVTLEHLRLKGKKIAAAYSAFGYAQDRWSVDDATGRGKVFLLHPKSEERDHPQYLFGQGELADHIREVKAAEQALASTIAQLSSLGIAD